MEKAIEEFADYLYYREKSEATIESYKSNLKVFNKYLEKKFNCKVEVDVIDEEELTDFLNYKKEQGCTPSTRNKYLFVFRSFFTFTEKKEITEENYAKDIKPVKTRDKSRTHLTREEVEELAESIDHEIVRYAVYTAFYTGLRPSELLDLKIEDVDFHSEKINVIKGKGNKDRVIPMASELKKLLEEYLEEIRPDTESEKLFASYQSGSMSHQFFNRKIGEAVEKLGWKKDVSAHVLRHSFASRLVEKDVSVEKIRRLLGHSSLRMTNVYLSTNPEALRDAVDKL